MGGSTGESRGSRGSAGTALNKAELRKEQKLQQRNQIRPDMRSLTAAEEIADRLESIEEHLASIATSLERIARDHPP